MVYSTQVEQQEDIQVVPQLDTKAEAPKIAKTINSFFIIASLRCGLQLIIIHRDLKINKNSNNISN